MPVDFLKLNRSPVRYLAHDSLDQHLVKALVQVARGLGQETIAEYVENEEMLCLPREYRVGDAQGNLIGRPPALEETSGESGRSDSGTGGLAGPRPEAPVGSSVGGAK